MPRGKGITNIVPLLTGVRADINSLFDRFVAVKTDDYSEFLKLWQQMRFYQMYLGYRSMAELRELTENALQIAFAHVVPNGVLPLAFTGSEEHEQKRAIFGVYVTYAMYFARPEQAKQARIIVTAAEVDKLVNWVLSNVMLSDVTTFVQRLLDDDAFSVHAFKDEHDPFNLHRLELDNGLDLRDEHESAVAAMLNETMVKTQSVDSLASERERFLATLDGEHGDAIRQYSVDGTLISDLFKRAFGKLPTPTYDSTVVSGHRIRADVNLITNSLHNRRQQLRIKAMRSPATGSWYRERAVQSVRSDPGENGTIKIDDSVDDWMIVDADK